VVLRRDQLRRGRARRVSYRATLDVPAELVAFVAGLLAANRRARGTRSGTRALGCWYQALFVLVWFRERRKVAITGRGFGISQATAYRYLDEAIEVLAAQAPDLIQALEQVKDEGFSHLVLHPAGGVLGNGPGHFDSDAGLSDASGPGDCDQTRSRREDCPDRGDLTLPPEGRCRRGR
jgi:hypothetical protein